MNVILHFTTKKQPFWRASNGDPLALGVSTYVVLVGLQGPLQCDGQLLVDLVNSCLDFHLDAPLRCFDAILPTVGQDKTLGDGSELKKHPTTVQ